MAIAHQTVMKSATDSTWRLMIGLKRHAILTCARKVAVTARSVYSWVWFDATVFWSQEIESSGETVERLSGGVWKVSRSRTCDFRHSDSASLKLFKETMSEIAQLLGVRRELPNLCCLSYFAFVSAIFPIPPLSARVLCSSPTEEHSEPQETNSFETHGNKSRYITEIRLKETEFTDRIYKWAPIRFRTFPFSSITWTRTLCNVRKC